MNYDKIKNDLNLYGYTIIENILTDEEININKNLFYNWKNKIYNHDYLHENIDLHGLYKYFNVGHNRYAWLIRLNKNVQDVFKFLWKTNDLIVSFDGSCYINENNKKKDNCWTHTDQAPKLKSLECYQGFVSLTNNKERTLVVYEGSHLIHKKYFEERDNNGSKNWNLIIPDFLESIKDTKKVLNVKAGSLVLWYSRTFHQNQY